MLSINPDIIYSIIESSRKFHAKEGVVIPETQTADASDEDWAYQALADHDSDLNYIELKTEIDNLEPDQQAALVALMWLGRGDYDVTEWKAALRDAYDRRTARTADYLISTPMIADYLEEGLDLLGYSRSSLE
jgi:hypothetical protein